MSGSASGAGALGAAVLDISHSMPVPINHATAAGVTADWMVEK